MAYCIYVLVVSIGKVEWWIVAFVVLTNAVMVVICVRGARAGARTTDEGVEVRNFRRTVFVPWDEIERFSVGEHGIAPKMGILERRDGERIGMWGIQGMNPAIRPKNRSAERVIDRLNAELRRRQSDDQTDDHATDPA